MKLLALALAYISADADRILSRIGQRHQKPR
jgi:hypothetical protein